MKNLIISMFIIVAINSFVLGQTVKQTQMLPRYKAYHECVQEAMKDQRWLGISACDYALQHPNIPLPSRGVN